MDTLEDLYYGNLFPHEKCAKFDDEMKELLSRNEEKHIEDISNNQKETFEKYKDCNGKFLKSANGNPLSLDLSLVQRLLLNQ